MSLEPVAWTLIGDGVRCLSWNKPPKVIGSGDEPMPLYRLPPALAGLDPEAVARVMAYLGEVVKQKGEAMTALAVATVALELLSGTFERKEETR